VALNHLNETVMTSLAQTNILMTIGLAVWLLGERFTLREWAATTVICAGVFLFRPWAAGNLTGFLILMSGLLCGSLATVGAKRWVERIPPPMLMLWRNGVALALVAVWCLGDETVRPSTAAALAAIGAGILGPYLHGLFFLQALERIEAAKASLTGRVQPVIVFLVSWIFLGKLPALGETLSAGLLVAGALLLVAARPRS
jgi:drug/metabolite transporter (DMT)-like permease